MIRLDEPLIADRFVLGNGGLGVKASELSADGFLRPRLVLPLEGDKRVRALVLQQPSEGRLSVLEDGSFDYIGPDGLHSFVYQLYVDGLASGVPTSVTIATGSQEGSKAEISVLRSVTWTIFEAAEATYDLGWSVRAEAAKAVVANWTTVAAIAKEVYTDWNMGDLLEIEQQIAWGMANVIEKQVQMDWQALELMEKDVPLNWRTAELMNKEINLLWGRSVPSEHRLELIWTMEHSDFISPINLILVKDENRMIIVN